MVICLSAMKTVLSVFWYEIGDRVTAVMNREAGSQSDQGEVF